MGRIKMTKGSMGILLILALLMALIPAIFSPASALADAPPQTSLIITKYAADGTTVLATQTVTYGWLEANLPVQGDGTTHYYTEGPTFDPNNLWDPNETCSNGTQADSALKDKGALKGTDLKDLCNLVGGAGSGDTINVSGADGYNTTFNQPDVYYPVSRQGPMVICWWKDGQYTGPGAWTDGMLLAFFTTVGRPSDGKLIFGNQDMHDCLPQSDWHFYYDGSIQYPSTDGLYIKWISTISIYTGGTTDWTVALNGAIDNTLTKTWLEDGIACHGAATYKDSQNNTWSGFPLWMVCGLIDDNVIHGPGAFNFSLAAAGGYDVKVTGAGGSSCTLGSSAVSGDGNMILANQLNGQPLSGADYPLKLVGSDISNGQNIGGITRIDLIFRPAWDLNNDHVCNIADVVSVVSHWGQTGTPGWIPTDLNHDGVINIGDVVVLGLHWKNTW